MEAMLNLALRNPTYETDYYAVDEILRQCGSIAAENGLLLAEHAGGHTYTLTYNNGVTVTHLLRSYAIHHLLVQYYQNQSA